MLFDFRHIRSGLLVGILAVLLSAFPAFAQEELQTEPPQWQGALPDQQESVPMFTIPPPATPGRDTERKPLNFVFNKPLDRTTPSIVLEPGAVTELRNMRRVAPGVPLGWTRRSGTSVYNATAIAAAEVKGLYQLVRPDHGIHLLFAQCNDQFYRSDSHPPSTCDTFGTSIHAVDSGASAAIGEKIVDDLVLAATGTSPWGWSGGTTYPDAAYMVHEVSSPQVYTDCADVLKRFRADLNIAFLQAAHSGGSVFYVGYHKRLEGISLDFVAGATNILAATTAVSAYRAGAWVAVTSLTDGTTDPTGVTPFYENSGRISWTYNASDDPHLLPNTKDHLFWYQVAVNADVTDGMLLRRARVHDYCEPLTNLWSKYYDIALSAMLSTTTGYQDYSGHVADGTQANYADLSSMASTQYFYLGFMYPAHGLYLQVDPDYVNDSTNTDVNIEYWNDSTSKWVAVSGSTVDGTSGDGKSLNHTGVVQWDGSQIDEGKRSIAGELLPLYYYRLSWTNGLPDGIHIWGAAQMEKPGYSPDPFEHYHGAAEYNGRALYWPGQHYRHGMDYSAMGKPWVMNGPDAGSTKDIFGPGQVNAFARIGSYGIVSTMGPYRLYLMQGKVPSQFDEYLISDVVGAVAPNTLKVIQDRVAIFASTKSVHAAVLLAPDGVYMAERVVINISQPISDYWDTSTTPYIEPDYAHLSYAWVNYKRKTVHFAVPMNLTGTGTQTTLNAELVYSYLTNEWADLYVRGNPASCGLDLMGTDDQRMAYIGDYSGHARRTDYGDDDDGTIITHWLKTADLPLAGLLYSSVLRRISAKFKTSNVYAGDCCVLVYPDGSDTGVTPVGSGGIMDLYRSGFGYTSGMVECGPNIRDLAAQAFESYMIELKSGVSTADKGCAMEVYGMALEFRPERETR